MLNDYCPPSRLHYWLWHSWAGQLALGVLVGIVIGLPIGLAATVLARWVFGQ